MADIPQEMLREQLVLRRHRLEAALRAPAAPPDIHHLLGEIDSALKRLDEGRYGICELCNEPVELERLAADPLVRFCIGHMSDRAQRELEDDLRLAALIQQRLLPANDLRFDGWEISYHYQPAVMVSGDYCDVVREDGGEEQALALLGDASGKGVAASMLMSQLHALFRSLAEFHLPVDQLVARASRLFCESTLASHFATLAALRLTPSGYVQMCNAGHCPVLLVKSGEVQAFDPTGLPLGLFCEGRFDVSTLLVAPGESIVLYTDGVIEAGNPLDDAYGMDRLGHALFEHRCDSARAQVDALVSHLHAFRNGVPLSDDVTAMVIRRIAGLNQ